MGIYSDVLLTVDYDRTLTAPDSTVPQRNLDAIRYFMDHGGTFTVNTGRSLPMTKAFRDIVSVNAPLLLYNGSAAYDMATGEVTFSKPIDLDLWQTIREVMGRFPDLTVEVQGLDAHYRFAPNPMWDAFSENNQCAHGFAAPGQDLGLFLKFALYGEIRENTVADLYNATPEEMKRMDEVERALIQTYGTHCEVFRPVPRIIDVHAKGVSKGKAAKQLQKKLGKRYLVCAGDGYNDLPMMQEADFAYCPADGLIADRFENVCSCGQGAVADVIYEKIPEILEIKP